MKKITLTFLCLLLFVDTFAQLRSGPMPGYSDMREVLIWAQTTQPARVKAVYWETDKPNVRYETDVVSTEKINACTAHLLADEALPGKRYQYEIWVNGRKVPVSYPLMFQTQPLWQWRTDPPPFRFAVGSCTYISEPAFDRPGSPYGGGYEIFGAINQQKPDFMLWTGDNTYLREVDWNSRTGVFRRYTHTRATKEMQPLLGSTHHYAIWDDHDFGPNDSDRGYWLKPVTLDAFKRFWGNPNYVFDDGTTGTFFWNDCQFFLLDNRSYRTPDNLQTPNRTLLGQKQFDWLIDALSFSKATFKFVVVGGQVVNPSAVFENYAIYGAERDSLLKAITDARIPGVIFISGDRHHTIVHKLDRPGTYPLYDLTISPLTSGPAKPREEELKQPTYVDGTLVTDRNFGMLEVSGPLNDRVLKVRVLDAKGTERWSRDIRARDLK